MAVKREVLYSTGEAAEMIGMAIRTLQLWIEEKKVAPTTITLGGHYRFTLEEINEIRERMGLPPLEEPIEERP